jgi:hypothetical protein
LYKDFVIELPQTGKVLFEDPFSVASITAMLTAEIAEETELFSVQF